MNKQDIIKLIHHRTGIERQIVAAVIDAFIGTIKECLSKNITVSIYGFGKFFMKEKRNQALYDFKEKTCTISPITYIPTFVCCKVLRKVLSKILKNANKNDNQKTH